jgi:hypothetical protein
MFIPLLAPWNGAYPARKHSEKASFGVFVWGKRLSVTFIELRNEVI